MERKVGKENIVSKSCGKASKSVKPHQAINGDHRVVITTHSSTLSGMTPEEAWWEA